MTTPDALKAPASAASAPIEGTAALSASPNDPQSAGLLFSEEAVRSAMEALGRYELSAREEVTQYGVVDAVLGASGVRREVEARDRRMRLAEDRFYDLQRSFTEQTSECARLAAVLEAAERERDENAQRIAEVFIVLSHAASGEFATAGRDFGRGVAELARRVRAALSGDGDPA